MQTPASHRLAGYAALIERFGLDTTPPWHRSIVADSNTQRVDTTATGVTEIYPSVYWPGNEPCDHLEFALKYDGTDLALLAQLLPAIGADAVAAWVSSAPQGKYARRAWYLFELLTGTRLAIADLARGNYIDLLDEDAYFVSQAPVQVRRQRVNDNLLGSAGFCPMVRRTATIESFIAKDFAARSRDLAAAYPPALLSRALNYLYTKETKSSFEIERITPDSSRTERFVSLLRSAATEDLCAKPSLIAAQNQIVDARFRELDYRTEQNYVGETVHYGRERIHYVCPRPEHVAPLMSGLTESHARMAASGVHPVVHAATVGYAFVFVHPFADGNGRLHRLLIHNILTRRGFVPAGLVFPVSVAMAENPAEYDASLEAFSRPVMRLADYTLDESGRMRVRNDLGPLYRYPDMTVQVEMLFAFIERTVESVLVNELEFLANYDRTKAAMQAVADLPDREIDLFIRLCLQNAGRMSQAKRTSAFAALSDDEVERLERCVQLGYRKGPERAPPSPPTPR